MTERLTAERERELRAGLQEHLAECNGSNCEWYGCPTVVEILATLDAAREETARLREEVAEYEQLAALQQMRESPYIAIWQRAENKPDTWPDYGEFIGWLLARLRRLEARGNA